MERKLRGWTKQTMQDTYRAGGGSSVCNSCGVRVSPGTRRRSSLGYKVQSTSGRKRVERNTEKERNREAQWAWPTQKRIRSQAGIKVNKVTGKEDREAIGKERELAPGALRLGIFIRAKGKREETGELAKPREALDHPGRVCVLLLSNQWRLHLGIS